MPAPASVLLNRLLARGKFRHLQVLLRVAELGSVQRAADAIGLTQSSVTQTLAYLELLLDERLFQRHARGVTPTPACIALLPVARQVLMGLAEGSEMVAARQRQGGIVRLLASQAAIHSLLIAALPGFHQRHPAIQVHLREAEGQDQLLAIARGEVDLVACRKPVAIPEGWRFTPLREDRFVVVCRAGHPLLRRRRLDWRLLGRETWLLAPAETAARLRFDELAQRFEAAPRTHPLVSRSIPLMLDTLRGSPLLALLPLSFVQHELTAGRLQRLEVGDEGGLDALGLLQPGRGGNEASQRLAEHLAATAVPVSP